MQIADSDGVRTVLDKEQQIRARNIFRNTPLVALPSGGMAAVKVETVEDVLTCLDGIVEYLRHEMNKHADTQDELDAIKRDLRAAGRLFRLITPDEPVE